MSVPHASVRSRPRILLLEPWYGGSHAGLVDWLQEVVDAEWTVETLPARHWKWRMRGAAAWFAARLGGRDADGLRRGGAPFDLLVATSYVPLAELAGLVPALAQVPKLLVFHENQLTYPYDPARGADRRDLHFGFTQLVSALAADRIAFNSAYHRDAFLAAGEDLLRSMPDHRPDGWIEQVRARSEVLPPPLGADVARLPLRARRAPRDAPEPPLVLWNHRWEHDKAPEELFEVLDAAWASGARFRLAVCGARARRVPPAFARAEAEGWKDRAEVWGPLPRQDYVDLLARADVVLSTARQEFLGLSVLEAVHAGARPLLVDRVAYTDLWPASWRAADPAGMATRLVDLARGTTRLPAAEELRAWTAPFTPEALAPAWRALLWRAAM